MRYKSLLYFVLAHRALWMSTKVYTQKSIFHLKLHMIKSSTDEVTQPLPPLGVKIIINWFIFQPQVSTIKLNIDCKIILTSMTNVVSHFRNGTDSYEKIWVVQFTFLLLLFYKNC